MALAKTEAGQAAFKERSPQLTSRQRPAFIMFDGAKSVQQVLAASAGLGMTQADVDQMVANGFLAENAPPPNTPAPPPASAKPEVSAAAASTAAILTPAAQTVAMSPVSTGLTNQQRYAQAWPLATQLTASLGLRGFRLNLAVESASGYDDLLALFPKILTAVGADKAVGLERALKG